MKAQQSFGTGTDDFSARNCNVCPSLRFSVGDILKALFPVIIIRPDVGNLACNRLDRRSLTRSIVNIFFGIETLGSSRSSISLLSLLGCRRAENV